MKGKLFLALMLATGLCLPGPASAIYGTDDNVPAASLVVPFFETGVNSNTHPQDTLLSVYATTGGTSIHVEVWNIDGERAASGVRNVDLNVAETWSVAMRDLINSMSASDRNRLREGDFYRGFVTIDHVTGSTALSPFNAAYPWSFSNVLHGYIYYTRLSEGSANGLSMLHLEALPDTSNLTLEGFYGKLFMGHTADRREELDADARACAQSLTMEETCFGAVNDEISAVRSRVFNISALNGSTRLIIFAWSTAGQRDDGGPSALCDGIASCSSTYTFNWRGSDGSINQSGSVRLDHVVNIIEITGPSDSGEALIFDIPNVPPNLTQFYAFTFNTAKPSGGAALNWDAIFPSGIDIDPATAP